MKNSQANLKNRKGISFFKNKVKLTTISCCIAFMALTNCTSNDDNSIATDCGNGAWTQSVQTELNTWLTAIQAYGEDPTPANCLNYKSAAQAYLNALNRIKTCVPTVSLTDFEQALEEAKEELNAIPC